MVENSYYVVDAHCHIYPEKIAEKAVAGTDKFYAIDSECKGTVADMLANGADAGIDHYIVQSVATTPKQVKSINEFISGEVNASEGRLTGLGTLHPDSADIKGDILHLQSLGLHGVKLHPDIQGYKIDDYRCLKIYELCEERHLPILMHTGDLRYDLSNPNRLIPIMKIYTGMTVIGAHFGGWSMWERASELLCSLPNLFVDCSSSFYALSDEQIVKIIHRYGANKVLFGTDYPMWSPKRELDRFLSLKLDDKEKKSILYTNAKKIFNLE